jgi:hypothetical protein
VADQYRLLLKAKGKPKATTAAARELFCYIYRMWKDGLGYEEWLTRRTTASWPEVRPTQRVGQVE